MLCAEGQKWHHSYRSSTCQISPDKLGVPLGPYLIQTDTFVVIGFLEGILKWGIMFHWIIGEARICTDPLVRKNFTDIEMSFSSLGYLCSHPMRLRIVNLGGFVIVPFIIFFLVASSFAYNWNDNRYLVPPRVYCGSFKRNYKRYLIEFLHPHFGPSVSLQHSSSETLGLLVNLHV